jgi:hypothetical protein
MLWNRFTMQLRIAQFNSDSFRCYLPERRKHVNKSFRSNALKCRYRRAVPRRTEQSNHSRYGHPQNRHRKNFREHPMQDERAENMIGRQVWSLPNIEKTLRRQSQALHNAFVLRHMGS